MGPIPKQTKTVAVPVARERDIENAKQTRLASRGNNLCLDYRRSHLPWPSNRSFPTQPIIPAKQRPRQQWNTRPPRTRHTRGTPADGSRVRGNLRRLGPAYEGNRHRHGRGAPAVGSKTAGARCLRHTNGAVLPPGVLQVLEQVEDSHGIVQCKNPISPL